MNNFGASGRIIQNVSVCHLKTPTRFGDNEKNPLVFLSRCEKSTCFFLPLEDQTSSEKTPYLHCRKTTTFRNNVLLRNFQNRRLKTSQPKTPSLVKIDSFFVAGTKTSEKSH
jgi:hypothetical protein